MNICKEKLKALEEGQKYYSTGKPCKSGHIAPRRVSDSRCMECSRVQASKYRKENGDVIGERSKVARKNNLEFFREREKVYREQDLENYKERELKYREQNREKARQHASDYYQNNIEHCKKVRRDYAKNNRGRLNALEAKRHAQKLKATPIWANQQKMLKMYEQCQQMNEDTNIVHNVDHIVPLQSDIVCGLHCEDNLQILTKDENLKKGNKHE